MGTKDAARVGETLEAIAKGEDEEELTYDPRSGKFEVFRKGEVVRDRDRVPATEMAREGFFV